MRQGKTTLVVVALVMLAGSLASARDFIPGDAMIQLAATPRLLGETEDFPGMWEYVYDVIATTDAGGANHTWGKNAWLTGFDSSLMVNRWTHGGVLWDGQDDPWNYVPKQNWCANSAYVPRSFNSGIYPERWPSMWQTDPVTFKQDWVLPTNPSYASVNWAYYNYWHTGGAYVHGDSYWSASNTGSVTYVTVDPDGVPGSGDEYNEVDTFTPDGIGFTNTNGYLSYYGLAGLLMTFRVVHPNAPGEITWGTYHNDGAAVTGTVLGPGPSSVYPDGDFDSDTHVDAADIDLLCDFIRNGLPYDALYDISADGVTGGTDGVVNMLDLDYLIRFLVETSLGNGTEYGDFNLDGVIDTTDLTRLATNYGDGAWKWSDGNANRYIDTNIDNTDLTILATYYGFVATPDVVPEPMTLSLLAVGAAALLRRRRGA